MVPFGRDRVGEATRTRGSRRLHGREPVHGGTAPGTGVRHRDRAAGSTEACETAFRSARRGGQVLLLGISGHGETARLPVDDVVNNDLRIRGSFSYTAAAWAQTVRLLNSGIFQPSRLVTHRFPLDRFASALSVLADPSSGEPRGKVLIEMRGEG